jgi:predicted secreted hydrolase
MLSEWWYYTGHLSSAAGERFGFEFVIFQSVRGAHPIGRLAHFAVTDPGAGRFAYDARSAIAARLPPTLDLDVQGWTLSGGDGEDRFSAQMEDYGLDLHLQSVKPAALHHGGLISFGPAGDSYYYSRTRMEVTGQLRRGDESTPVTGQAWHDHQWGNFIVPAVGGWDWISVQLDDGRDLMLTLLRGADGTSVGAYGTFVDVAGVTVDVPEDAIQVRPTGSWTSARTGTAYPSGWDVDIAPDSGAPALALTLSPLMLDQELAFETNTYWEGAVDVSGTAGGVPVAGKGYVELTGYAP